MVTKLEYIQNIAQIAKLFCKDQANKILCEASIISRLTQRLDDNTFPIFLEKLTIGGRMYMTNLEAFQNKGFRIVIVDLITGLRETAWWDVIWNMPYYGKLASVLLSHKFQIISENKTFNQENATDIRITWNASKPGYGITFVPSEIPGSGGGSGGGGGGTVIQTPPVQTPVQTPVSSGFNFEEILNNPMVLIGAGLLAVYFIMKK